MAAKRRIKWGLWLGLALTTTAAHGHNGHGDPPYFTESDLLEELPAVNGAAGFEQQERRAPASVTVISRQMIELSGARTLADVFRLVPGFQSYYINNNRYGISYHGIGREFPNQLEVMIDGRSVYEPVFSSVSWGTLGINLSDIDHIEVVRGSNAPAQGSNAFLGSVNIVTRKPFEAPSARMIASAGDLNSRRAQISISDHNGALHYRGALGYEHNDGFPSVAGEGDMEDGVESYNANFRGIYTPTLADTLDFSVGYGYQRLGWGDGDRPDEFSQSRFDSHHQSLLWNRQLKDDQELQLHAYHNRFRARNETPLGRVYQFLGIDQNTAETIAALDPLPPSLVSDFADASGIGEAEAETLLDNIDSQLITGFGTLRSDRYDVEIKRLFRAGDSIQGTFGLGGRYEELAYEHPQGTDKTVDEWSWRGFAHAEWQALSWLTLNAGAMVERTFVGNLISPRVSANFHLDPNNTVRLAAARSHRMPALQEANEYTDEKIDELVYNLFAVFDPNLKEETLESLELGYLLQLPEPTLVLDVRVFHEEVEDLISDVDMPTSYPTNLFDDEFKSYENAGRMTTTGAEMELRYQPDPATLIRLHYTNVDLDSRLLVERDPRRVTDIDNRMARHSGGLLVGHRFGEKWSASVFTYHQSEVRWEGGNFIDDFTRVDAQLSYHFTVGNTQGTLRLIGQSLDGDYSEFNVNNKFETRVFVEGRLALP